MPSSTPLFYSRALFLFYNRNFIIIYRYLYRDLCNIGTKMPSNSLAPQLVPLPAGVAGPVFGPLQPPIFGPLRPLPKPTQLEKAAKRLSPKKISYSDRKIKRTQLIRRF